MPGRGRRDVATVAAVRAALAAGRLTAASSPDGTQIVFDRDAAIEPVGEDDRLFVGDVPR
jgi:YD repeat-containing protein